MGLALTAFLALASCGEAEVIEPGQGSESTSSATGAKADSSVDAIFVDFEWDGELWTESSSNPAKQVETQLLFTIGQLNGERAVGRLDKVKLTNVEVTEDGELTHVTYHATMPVAWGKQDAVPETYRLLLPTDISFAGQERFTESYGHRCVDSAAHDVDSGSMWYYYRPHRSGC